MAVKTDAVGKEWPGTAYEVGLEKLREYANAVGEQDPVHHDRAAAQKAGFRDVVAPPMFCVVYCAPSIGPVFFDPEVALNWATMLHGSQEFVWGEPVCAGDVITTATRCASIDVRGDKAFYVFETTSKNQDGETTATGTWTNIVRGV